MSVKLIENATMFPVGAETFSTAVLVQLAGLINYQQSCDTPSSFAEILKDKPTALYVAELIGITSRFPVQIAR
jgi:hypothetical protein